MSEPYDPGRFPPFAVTVDLVVLTIADGELKALLVRRGQPPYRGRLALPGGFTRIDEDIEHAAYRELEEEAGIGPDKVHLEQLRTYGDPRRDPRMRVVSVAWLALGAGLPRPVAGTDASAAHWLPVEEALAATGARRLAFDHATILADGLERARAKLEYTSLATRFCPEQFTVAQLREVYEIVWGTRLDPANFHRKITGATGFVEPTGERTAGGRGRPAALYRAGPTTELHPPVLRPSAG
jgi:8-oxo-dGTP diphosphatase